MFIIWDLIFWNEVGIEGIFILIMLIQNKVYSVYQNHSYLLEPYRMIIKRLPITSRLRPKRVPSTGITTG